MWQGVRADVFASTTWRPFGLLAGDLVLLASSHPRPTSRGVDMKRGCQVHQDGQGYVGPGAFDFLHIPHLQTRLLRQHLLRPSLLSS